MKKLLSVLFAAALALSACSGSDEADDAASVVTDGEDQTTVVAEPEGDATTEDEPAEEPAESDNDGGDLSDDEAALADALTAEDLKDGAVPFTDAEVQCVNEGVVRAVGLDALNGYGITVDTPDSSLLPDEYEVQAATFSPLTDCLDVRSTFEALAPDCDLALSDEEFDLAFEYDFLGTFEEYDNPAAAEASAALQAQILACDSAS